MTRGNQRDKDREKAKARAAKNNKKKGNSAPKVGGKNANAEALAAKIAAKKAAKEAGLLQEKKKDRGTKFQAKSKVEAMVNPHTGKKDPEWTKKQARKGK